MKTEIESVLPSGYGHWKVKCFRYNWSKKKSNLYYVYYNMGGYYKRFNVDR